MSKIYEIVSKNPVASTVVTLAVLVGGYFGLKRIFQKPEPPPLPGYDLPEGGAGIPQVDTIINPKTGAIEAVFWSPQPLANELFDVMEGLWDSTQSKEDAWFKLANLPTKDMLVATYNYFNTMPKVRESGDTLTIWINKEYGSLVGGYKDNALNVLRAAGLP